MVKIFRCYPSLCLGSLVILCGLMTGPLAAAEKTALFAGGCFWCTEADFEALPGVIRAESGYTGGAKADPTYEEVSSGTTGHTESVRVTYDPDKVGYEKLVFFFFTSIDPTVKDAQFCDHGSQYRTGIYTQSDEEKATVAQAIAKVSLILGKQVVTETTTAAKFYLAEEYHQDYARKNPLSYKYYRYRCGRDERLKELWADKAGRGL